MSKQLNGVSMGELVYAGYLLINRSMYNKLVKKRTDKLTRLLQGWISKGSIVSIQRSQYNSRNIKIHLNHPDFTQTVDPESTEYILTFTSLLFPEHDDLVELKTLERWDGEHYKVVKKYV